MKQRFLSGFIVVALMASVIAGAMGVSLNYASADNGTEILYWSDFKSKWLDIASDHYQYNTMKSIFDNVDSKWNDSSFNFFVFEDDSGNTVFISFQYTYGDGFYGYGWGGISTLKAFPSGNSYFSLRGFFRYTNNQFTQLSFDNQSIDWANRNFALNLSTDDTPRWYFLSNYEISAGLHLYSLRNLVAAGDTGWNFVANVDSGSAPPEYDEINLVTFNVGIKRFLTVDDQDFVQGMDPDKEEYTWAILGLDKDGNDFDIVLSDVDLVVVQNADFYTDELFNLATYGALCWELPDELDVVVSSGFGVRNVLGQIDHLVAFCINCPYWINEELPTEEQLQDEQYMQAFNSFNTYVESYNTTHVIPENLADTLFGLNGSRLYPCNVSVPVAVWNANTSGGSSFADSHNWKWWFPSRSDYGINFELMDVVIVTEPYNDKYSLLYYYSDSLNVPFQYIQNMTFDELLEEFDCIIIIPDDLNCLDGNVWWKNLLTDVCTFLGISNLTSNLLTSLAMSGSDSNGVEYVTSRPDEVPGILQGFCIVTKKAIQRQQLYVFNDGITKTYKLMSDYIENREKWEDSFLLWTASLFSQWQSLDGKLGNIYNLLYGWNLSSVLSDISESLARIANNTSEEDPGYWFLSLFNWLNRFSVTDSDFANWVSEYDDFTDDLPDPGTGATVIPFPTAIPTVAVGG